jgi:hypothetical protein
MNINLDLIYDLIPIKTVNLHNSTSQTNQNFDSIKTWKIGDPIVEAQNLQTINNKVLLTTRSNEQPSQTRDFICETI